MYGNKRVLCVIPARGGSKGLPGKNVMLLAGKPLIAHTIGHARGSRYIDRTIVSTEDGEIARVALENGAEVPFRRPAELAADDSGTMDVLAHAVEAMETGHRCSFEILVLLHATAPLRRPEDIDNCIELLAEKGAGNVFSVARAQRNPYFNMVETKPDGRVGLVKDGSFTTRQDAPPVYELNSSIYVWRMERFKKERSIFSGGSAMYEMPRERSIDIDDLLDLRMAEMIMAGEGACQGT